MNVLLTGIDIYHKHHRSWGPAQLKKQDIDSLIIWCPTPFRWSITTRRDCINNIHILTLVCVCVCVCVCTMNPSTPWHMSHSRECPLADHLDVKYVFLERDFTADCMFHSSLSYWSLFVNLCSNCGVDIIVLLVLGIYTINSLCVKCKWMPTMVTLTNWHLIDLVTDNVFVGIKRKCPY